jgi:FG-GAP-like repeat
MFTRKLILALCLAAGSTLALAAQQPAPAPATVQTPPAPAQAAQPETPRHDQAKSASAVDGGEPHWIRPETAEQRKVRLGTTEDPGQDPDPTKRWWRYDHMYFLEKADRRWASFDNPPQEGWIRPFGFVNFYRELYQMNDKWVWTWKPDPADPSNQVAAPEVAEPAPTIYTAEAMDYLAKVRAEFTPLGVPPADVTVRFEESSQGLPMAGSWRNSLAVADMNGDGCPDIIAPPERGIPNGVPAIFLGDCKGHWTFWKDVKWPRALDYGSVVAADFNKDGHMDLAFGVHLTGVLVFLGDGKGNFTDSSAGLPQDFPTRRVIVADVDRDGFPDVVALSEGPTVRDELKKNPDYGRLRVYYNREKGKKWEGANIVNPGEYIGGDWLSSGDFNGDKIPDFIAASIYLNGPNVLWLSDGPKKFISGGGNGKNTLLYSFYYANTVGHFSSKKNDDAIASFVRLWPNTLDEKLVPPPAITAISGLDRLSVPAPGKEPVRTPIVRWAGGRGVWGLAAGDFDGDGNTDLIYTHGDPRGVDILLGDGKGGFRRAAIEGLKLEANTIYDIKVADVNGDGKPDVIIAYESSGSTMLSARDGSIRVFLNRGAGPATKAAAKP